MRSRPQFRIPVIGNGDLTSGRGCRATSRGNRHRRRDDRTRRHEFAMDFSADQTLPRHRRTFFRRRPRREKWELIQRHCRLAVEEWGGRRPGDALDARAADGLFQRISREQNAARKIPARLDAGGASREIAAERVIWRSSAVVRSADVESLSLTPCPTMSNSPQPAPSITRSATNA